jgi:hypothetical protein
MDRALLVRWIQILWVIMLKSSFRGRTLVVVTRSGLSSRWQRRHRDDDDVLLLASFAVSHGSFSVRV